MNGKNDRPRCNFIAYLLGRLIMRVSGWRVEGTIPDVPRMMIIGAPHTSNFDLLFLLGAAFSLRLPVNWLGKHTLFRGPHGYVLRKLGGIPVDRSGSKNLVNSLAEDIRTREHCAIIVAPAGTRSRTEYWKSGFYWIAKNAGIPIVCGYLDYDRKVAGIGESFHPGDNLSADMDRIRSFYRDITPCHPEKKSRIRLREEQDVTAGEHG
ncbi:MAG: lysophospholipid acyltransferase family protein [Pseudomonadales bacterium]|nr:lysophospholipid acyltransferase family protein [Pseudomonadales bacterium]